MQVVARLGQDMDLAAAHTDAGFEQHRHRAAKTESLGGRSNCAQASSSCNSGTPNTAMHGIADELLHRAAVTLDRLAHGLEVARHHSAIDLGIEVRCEPRRIDEIAE